MTTKDKHVLTFWYQAFIRELSEANSAISAGRLARSQGQAVNTAKRYLKRLVGEGAIIEVDHVYPNGVKGKLYDVLPLEI